VGSLSSAAQPRRKAPKRRRWRRQRPDAGGAPLPDVNARKPACGVFFFFGEEFLHNAEVALPMTLMP